MCTGVLNEGALLFQHGVHLHLSSSSNPKGDDDEEESGEERLPSCFDYIMHFLTVFWKVLFAFVPPTEYWNGWACFIVSISLIGVLTAVTGDLASHFGCTIGLKDSVTAVVFVALGTSVPGECQRFDSACQVERREIKREIRQTLFPNSREDGQTSFSRRPQRAGRSLRWTVKLQPVSSWRDALSFHSIPSLIPPSAVLLSPLWMIYRSRSCASPPGGSCDGFQQSLWEVDQLLQQPCCVECSNSEEDSTSMCVPC